jgi:hypothetical protein
VHSALGDLEAAFRMLIAGSRTQASSNDAAAMEFLQPPHIELEALSQNKPKGSPEAAAQVCQGNRSLIWSLLGSSAAMFTSMLSRPARRLSSDSTVQRHVAA